VLGTYFENQIYELKQIDKMTEIFFKSESYEIIGICMEVHKILGKGHNEALYKDAVEYELALHKIPYKRAKTYEVQYKEIILSHRYSADFVILDKILLEIRAIEKLTSGHIKQTLNFLAASKNRLGLLINFGEDSLKYQRVVL